MIRVYNTIFVVVGVLPTDNARFYKELMRNRHNVLTGVIGLLFIVWFTPNKTETYH